MSINTTSTSPANDEIDLGKLFGILLDNRWMILAVTTLFALIGVAYALLATPIYKADALIQVEQKSNGGISSLVGDMGELFASESSATTEIELIKSRMVLGKTVEKFNLTTVATPNYFPLVGKGLARLMGEEDHIAISRFNVPAYYNQPVFTLTIENPEVGTYLLESQEGKEILKGKAGALSQHGEFSLFVTDLKGKAGDSFTVSKRSELDAIQAIQQNLSVSERGKQTGMLALTYQGENRNQIVAILNDIAENYFLQNVERNSAEAEKSLEFLRKQLPEIKATLTTAEDKLNRFRQANDSVDLALKPKLHWTL